jgi:hypothetical protein
MAYFVVIGIAVVLVLASMLWIAVRTQRARSDGRICVTCRFDSGDGDCFHGMGWEPRPALEWCSVWSPKDEESEK